MVTLTFDIMNSSVLRLQNKMDLYSSIFTKFQTQTTTVSRPQPILQIRATATLLQIKQSKFPITKIRDTCLRKKKKERKEKEGNSVNQQQHQYSIKVSENPHSRRQNALLRLRNAIQVNGLTGPGGAGLSAERNFQQEHARNNYP